jgi:anti-sigma B factor antagonist
MILELQATPEEVMRAVEALQEFGQTRQVPEKTLFGLALALEECASNIVNHAYRRDPRQRFQVVVEHTGGAMTVELRDRGPEFNPTLARVAEAMTRDEDAAPGGWGIQLVRHYMDEVRYAREGGENVLRLTKRLAGEGPPGITLPNAAKQENTRHEKAPIDMPLEIQILKDVSAQKAGAVTVKLSGSLDTATAPELERQLAPVLASGVKDLVYDLANLKFISSAGLRVFSTTRKQLKERGGQASFIHMQPQIQEVFEIMKSLPGVAIFKDVAELDRYLAARQRAHEEN